MDLRTSQTRELVHGYRLFGDEAKGISGVIAIDSTALGPAAGGCRLWHYDDPKAMYRDAVRLARGMSYKNAMAELPFGGGKAVLNKPKGDFDRAALFRLFAEAVNDWGGIYVTAEDVGTSVEDMKIVAAGTSHVAGLDPRPGKAGGDPSGWTALGVFQSMQVASRFALGSDVRGLRVAVQGTGNVGGHLCEMLHEAGAKLVVADIDAARATAIAKRYGAQRVGEAEILAADADILAPCALGAVLTEKSIAGLKVGLVCGGANNQLAGSDDGNRLLRRGIVYAPDYVVNAGGIINVAAEYLNESNQQVQQRVEAIAPRLATLLQRARQTGRSPHDVADEMAQQRIAAAEALAA